MKTPWSTDRTDRALLIEMALVAGLIVLAILFYWRPAADGVLEPRWWHPATLAALFFAIAALHTWRKRRLNQKALHQALREQMTMDVDGYGASTAAITDPGIGTEPRGLVEDPHQASTGTEGDRGTPR